MGKDHQFSSGKYIDYLLSSSSVEVTCLVLSSSAAQPCGYRISPSAW